MIISYILRCIFIRDAEFSEMNVQCGFLRKYVSVVAINGKCALNGDAMSEKV